MKYIFIKNLKELEYCFLNKINYLLFTNLTSVSYVAKTLYKFDIFDLNLLQSDAITKKLFTKDLKLYLDNLNYLDTNISSFLNIDDFNNSSPFYSLYRYSYLHFYLGIKLLSKLIKKFIKKFKVKEIILFESSIDNNNLKFFILIFRENNVKVKIIKKKFFIKKKNNFFLFLSLKDKIKNYCQTFLNHKSRDLVILPTYSYNEINNFVKKNYITISSRFFDLHNCKKKYLPSKKILIKINKKIDILFFSFLINDFVSKSDDLLKKKQEFESFILKKRIKRILWGLPPVNHNSLPFLIKNLNNKNIKVIGFQHGAHYGQLREDLNNILHYLSDYNFCDLFICKTYFDKKKIKINYFFEKIKLCIFKRKIPYKVCYKILTNKKINIVYVPNITQSVTFPKLTINSNEMFELQKQIYFFLKNLKYNFLIKINKNLEDNNYAEAYFPFYFFLKKNYKKETISTSDWNNVLKKNYLNIIILDQLSTPLDELINNEDTLIICFTNNMIEPSKSFAKLVKNKVLFIKNVEEFKKIIIKFIRI